MKMITVRWMTSDVEGRKPRTKNLFFFFFKYYYINKDFKETAGFQ